MNKQQANSANGRSETASSPQGASAGISTPAKIGGAIIVVVVVIAVAVGAYALMQIDTWGARDSQVSERFQLDLTAQIAIDPRLIGYVEQAQHDLSLAEPHALAVGPGNSIYIGGQDAVEWMKATGEPLGSFSLDQPADCLAIAGDLSALPGQIYVGSGRHVLVFDSSGELVSRWPELSESSRLTAIALVSKEIFVADAGQRVVWRFNADGQLLGKIGDTDPNRQMPQFVMPSPYFDLVAGDDEQVCIVNPGMRRIEAYSYDGELQSFWGQDGSSISDFFGCCNPAHLARLPDGRFVTSEKGIPRIKVYTRGGEFEAVVAGPEELGVSAAALGDARGNQAERVFDIAVGEQGEIFVLDARDRCVRVFRAKDVSSGETK
jgi:hypothetical protein